MQKLRIDLQSFQFTNGLIQANDTVRVSITTLPENRKQALIIDAKKLKNFHHFFSINISYQTEKILFVIRKKNIVQNSPIIASTVIYSNQIPMSNDDQNNKEVKNINLYEPVQSLNKKSNKKRKILGLMQVQFSLIPLKKIFEKNSNCKTNTIKVSHIRGYSKIDILGSNENESSYLNSEYLLCN